MGIMHIIVYSTVLGNENELRESFSGALTTHIYTHTDTHTHRLTHW